MGPATDERRKVPAGVGLRKSAGSFRFPTDRYRGGGSGLFDRIRDRRRGGPLEVGHQRTEVVLLRFPSGRRNSANGRRFRGRKLFRGRQRSRCLTDRRSVPKFRDLSLGGRNGRRGRTGAFRLPSWHENRERARVFRRRNRERRFRHVFDFRLGNVRRTGLFAGVLVFQRDRVPVRNGNRRNPYVPDVLFPGRGILHGERLDRHRLERVQRDLRRRNADPRRFVPNFGRGRRRGRELRRNETGHEPGVQYGNAPVRLPERIQLELTEPRLLQPEQLAQRERNVLQERVGRHRDLRGRRSPGKRVFGRFGAVASLPVTGASRIAEGRITLPRATRRFFPELRERRWFRRSRVRRA